MRQATLFVALILAGALLARWPIASHDLEHYIGPDEGEVVENVLEMVKTGDFDHRHPGYPGFHFYLQRILAEARLLFDGRTVAEIARADFYLGARRATLVAGVATAAVVFACGLRFLSPFGAALAAALSAFSPLAFRESAVVNPDLTLALFVAIALLFDLRLMEDPKPARYLSAGVATGLAAAVKYTGAFAFVPFVTASLLASGGKRGRAWALAGVAAAFAAFAIASPYTLLNLDQSLRGFERHVGYYTASESNAALELVRVLGTRGLGIVAGLFGAWGIVLALSTREPRRLVVLGYPLAYLLVFALFDRAYPRHALVVLPPLALLAADAVEKRGGKLRWALAFLMLAGPLFGSLQLFIRARTPSPADRAAAWALAEIPAGSRVLQDGWTPRLDPERFRVHRIRVEERVFPGNYDWVFYSGYPPGIDASSLRQVSRFENEDALGAPISVYQVPDRGSLMGTTLGEGELSVEIGAGELPYFGEGFDPPSPGAFGTERLSRGKTSEIFFVLPSTSEPPALALETTMATAVDGTEVEVVLELNGRDAGTLQVARVEPRSSRVAVPAELSIRGLNRLVLRYAATSRLDRRHRDTAVRFYRLRLTRY